MLFTAVWLTRLAARSLGLGSTEWIHSAGQHSDEKELKTPEEAKRRCEQTAKAHRWVQFVNTPNKVVDEALQGAVRAQPHLRLIRSTRVVVRDDIDDYRKFHVTLISGGGSGHEPAHVGYVGSGMLSAAVCGDVFASPPPNEVLQAILRCASPLGVVLIVKNYTGDRLNFGIAAERAKAMGIKVEMVIVDDDCALPRSDRIAGRRGLAGTVFVHKVAGALSEAGASMETILETLHKTVKNIGTVGVSASPCIVPGRGPSFELAHGTIEFGLGIHGESGVARKPFVSAEKTCREMLQLLFSQDARYRYMSAPRGARVALLVNNLGGTSCLEMSVMTNEAIRLLIDEYKCDVQRVYCGSFMTSLGMAGLSLSILSLDQVGNVFDMPVEQWLDFPTDAPGWTMSSIALSAGCPGPRRVDSGPMPLLRRPAYEEGAEVPTGSDLSAAPQSDFDHVVVKRETAITLERAIVSACNDLIAAEPEITKLDQLTGDGDCGYTMRDAAQLLLQLLENTDVCSRPLALIQRASDVLEKHMGGSSGALYSIFLTAVSATLASHRQRELNSAVPWIKAMRAGVDALKRYGGADVGDRTMLDVLIPACEFLEAGDPSPSPSALKELARRVMKMANQTSELKARAGRSSYVDHAVLAGHPDPGAVAAACWLRAACLALAE